MKGRCNITRINIGIPPSELCDQHLLAEYRELPRMVAFSHKVKEVPDVSFTLGAGHMKSCVRYGRYLASRHAALIVEMDFRGFTPAMQPISWQDFRADCQYSPSWSWTRVAAPIVADRIRSRLQTMKRKPTWTNRERPAWSYP